MSKVLDLNSEDANTKGTLKGCSEGVKDIKDIEVACEEVKTEPKKEVVLVGFDRIAVDMKKKVEKLARQKGISSFNIMGIPTREGVPKYSGGMVGNPEVLVEGLYNMANQRPEIKALLEITVNALREAEVLRKTKLSELLDAGKIKAGLFNILNNAEIYDLTQLTTVTVDEVMDYKNLGEQSLKDLTKLLHERGLDFGKAKKPK
jgi:hypothetical protein